MNGRETGRKVPIWSTLRSTEKVTSWYWVRSSTNAELVLLAKLIPKLLNCVRYPALPPTPPVGSMNVVPPTPCGPSQPPWPLSKSTTVVVVPAWAAQAVAATAASEIMFFI